MPILINLAGKLVRRDDGKFVSASPIAKNSYLGEIHTAHPRTGIDYVFPITLERYSMGEWAWSSPKCMFPDGLEIYDLEAHLFFRGGDTKPHITSPEFVPDDGPPSGHYADYSWEAWWTAFFGAGGFSPPVGLRILPPPSSTASPVGEYWFENGVDGLWKEYMVLFV